MARAGDLPTKDGLRALARRRRAALDPAVRSAAGRDLARRFFELPEARGAAIVAAYVSDAAEPPTGPLLDAVVERGATVLLPVVMDGGELDWAPYRSGGLRPGRFGLSEPATPAWGPEAIGRATVVACPCVAVDLSGARLGRGGGYYDRALRRCAPTALRCALAFDADIVEAVPVEPHDVLLDAAITPTRILRFDRRE